MQQASHVRVLHRVTNPFVILMFGIAFTYTIKCLRGVVAGAILV
jgi:hypothetical protein